MTRMTNTMLKTYC